MGDLPPAGGAIGGLARPGARCLRGPGDHVRATVPGLQNQRSKSAPTGVQYELKPGPAPAVLSLTESARQTSEAIDHMPENLTSALAKNSEALGGLLPGIQATVADSRAVAEIAERILKADTGAPPAEPWTPGSSAAVLRELQGAAREVRATLQEVDNSPATAESLPLDKLLKTASQEVMPSDLGANQTRLHNAAIKAGKHRKKPPVAYETRH